MSETSLTIGMDRFIARRWADYALDLRLSGCSSKEAYNQLKDWLAVEIKAKEISRKTANQLRRLWLTTNDPFTHLQQEVDRNNLANDVIYRPILHYGMALNVFPFFRELCITAGRLLQMKGSFQRKEVQHRLREKFSNPETVNRATDRCLLTLVDWTILEDTGSSFTARTFPILNDGIAAWFICSLLQPLPEHKLSVSDLANSPEKLRIELQDERGIVRNSEHLTLLRNGLVEEIVSVLPNSIK